MKCLSPLLLAYEDRMKEKDELLQTAEVNCVIDHPGCFPRFGRLCFNLFCKKMSPSQRECVCFSQEQVQRLRARAEEVIQENERLQDDITKMSGTSREDWSEKQTRPAVAWCSLQSVLLTFRQLVQEYTLARWRINGTF